MRYREILEAIDNDDDMFAPRFQFGNLSRPEALEKYNDLYDELYGYESYWHGDEPEFEEKERELERLKIYARQKFGEAFYNHMIGAEQTRDNRSDVFSKKDPFSNRQHREDPRITKAGKLHKQDVLGLRNDVKNRIGTHRTPVLPESEDDDMFAGPGDFSKNLKSSIQQETDPYRRLVVKVREISKQLLGVSARVSMSPAAVGRPVQKLGRATFLFGKFPQGSTESLELVRRMQEALTDLGLDTKVTNSGWLSVKVPAPFASLDENNDDELFGSAPSAATLTQSIARAIVRSDKSARLITSPFMVGFALGKTPGGEPLLHYWKSMGKDKQDAMLDGINDAVYDLIANKVTENDESDDELFGDGQQKAFVVTAPDDEILGMFDDIREAIAQAKKQVPIYLEDGWGDDDFITVYKHNRGEESGVPVAYYPITDNPIDENDDSDDDLFAAPTLRFDDAFNEYDEDELQQQGFSYGEDPAHDVDIINDYLEGYKNYRVVKLTGGGGMGTDDLVLHLDRSSQLGEEESDDEMFGVSGSAAQRMIYKFGKQMLAKLEQAYNNSHVKAEYEKLTQGEEPDANRLFDLVCRATSTPFGKAMVVDSILREYAGGFNGLNDFGTLIDSGEWQNDIVDMWDMFGNDPDVAQQDWFQKEIQTFMGDR